MVGMPKRTYTITYRETTYGIRGGMIDTDVELESDDVEKVLSALRVACIGPSRKTEILIKIKEEVLGV